jgi:small multidrug resistance pump
MSYAFLGIAIVAEVIGTLTLKSTQEFTRLWPSVTVAISYAIAFYFMTLAMRTIPIGIGYAVWSGIGVVLITLGGVAIYGQRLDTAAVVGISLITAGVLIINLLSKTAGHGA